MVFAQLQRPRRNRQSGAWRSLVREHSLSPQHFVLPLFVREGEGQQDPVESMPGVYRQSIDLLVQRAAEAWDLGIPAVALFPVLPDGIKDRLASESTNADGLLQRCVMACAKPCPNWWLSPMLPWIRIHPMAMMAWWKAIRFSMMRPYPF